MLDYNQPIIINERENLMKRTIYILCVLITFSTVAYAADLYDCVDRKGNHVITTSPSDDMVKCIKSGSDEVVSPGKNTTSQSESRQNTKQGSGSQCDEVATNMNDARTYLNQAAQRPTAELEGGREDVKQAFDYLLEAQRKSSYCQCSSLGEAIYSAAQYASAAVSEQSVERFSSLLKKAIQAFNEAHEAYQNCK
jgi:cellobiose-specific phosphotransferase system component IIA